MPYVVRPMRLEDIDEVSQVERECFTTPWPPQAYRREIRDNRLSRYIVLTWVDDQLPDSHEAPRTEEAGDDRLSGVRRAFSQILRPLGLATTGVASEAQQTETIVGFAGMWLMLDEAHITTICVAERFRGQGFGDVLLSEIMDQAVEIGARRVTLEVRVSNHVAQALYRKYGFTGEGIRRRYYSDNNEDALIMWSQPLDDPAYRRRLAELREAALERLEALSAAKPKP